MLALLESLLQVISLPAGSILLKGEAEVTVVRPIHDRLRPLELLSSLAPPLLLEFLLVIGIHEGFHLVEETLQ